MSEPQKLDISLDKVVSPSKRVKRKCNRCEKEYESGVIDDGVASFVAQIYCDNCQALLEAEADQRKNEKARNGREHTFLSLCPPLYQRTDLQKVPASRMKAVREYLDNYPDFAGAVLKGPTGTQKTRCLWLILKHFILNEGMSCAYWSATELQAKIADSHRANKHYSFGRAMRQMDVLAIDDLGRERPTGGFEQELFDLIKHRLEYDKVTLISTQLTGAKLRKRYQEEDTADALNRRFNEHYKIIQFRG